MATDRDMTSGTPAGSPMELDSSFVSAISSRKCRPNAQFELEVS
jgi:hypothetical protein